MISIYFNGLKDERDLEQQFVALKATQAVAEAPALQGLVNAETFRGVDAALPVYLSCLKNGPQTEAKAIVVPCLPTEGSSRAAYEERR